MRVQRLSTCVIIFALTSIAAFGQVSVVGSMTHVFESVPGEEYTGSVVVRNSSDEPRTVQVLQTDYQFSANGRVFYDPPGSHTRSNANWIAPAARSVTIPARSDATVSYVVRTPSKILAGTYWSVLIIESALEDDAVGGTNAVGVQHVMRFAVQIVSQFSDGEEDLIVAGAHVSPTSEGAVLSLDIANAGTQMLRPNVTLELYARDGRSTGPIVADPKRLYPGSSLRFDLPLSGLAPGEYRALAIIDGGGEDVYAVQYSLEL